MKPRIFFFSLLTILSSTFAQTTNSNEITPQQTSMGKAYQYQGKLLLNHGDFKAIYINSPDSLKLAKSSEGLYITGLIFAGSGSALIGYPLGQGLVTKNYNVGLILAGVGVATVGIIFAGAADNNLKKSVNLFNEKAKGGKTVLSLQFDPSSLSLNGRF